MDFFFFFIAFSLFFNFRCVFFSERVRYAFDISRERNLFLLIIDCRQGRKEINSLSITSPGIDEVTGKCGVFCRFAVGNDFSSILNALPISILPFEFE